MPPVDLLYWSLAATPLAMLLITLVVFQWKVHEASAVGMFAALAIALGMYRMDLAGLAVASVKGVWESIVIL